MTSACYTLIILLLKVTNLKKDNLHLKQVFETLRQVNLKLSPKKCNLFKDIVAFLAHIVSSEGISIYPEKVVNRKPHYSLNKSPALPQLLMFLS